MVATVAGAMEGIVCGGGTAAVSGDGRLVAGGKRGFACAAGPRGAAPVRRCLPGIEPGGVGETISSDWVGWNPSGAAGAAKRRAYGAARVCCAVRWLGGRVGGD